MSLASRHAAQDSAFQETIFAAWRQWVRYLEAQQVVLAERRSGGFAPSLPEATEDDLAARVREAEGRLAAIPSRLRTVFDKELEQARQDALTRAESAGERAFLDPDALDERVLVNLLALAHGTVDPDDSRGQVPTEEGWYTVDVALAQGRAATAYALAHTGEGQRARLLLGALGLVVALGLSGLWLWWSLRPSVSANVASAMLVNTKPTAPWTVREVVLTGSDAATTTVALSETAGAGEARWIDASRYPPRLCLPVTALQDAREVMLVGRDGAPDRMYVLQQSIASSGDLALTSCDGSTSTRWATISETRALEAAQLGATLRVDGQPITLQEVSVRGTHEDRSLPQGQVEVALRVTIPTTFDIPAAKPTLVLFDGAERSPVRPPERDGESVVLRYLVPAFVQPRDAVWSLSNHADRVARWRLTLDVPVDRRELLQGALAVSTPMVETDSQGTIVLVVTLKNQGDTPLTLAGEDVSLVQADAQAVLSLPAETLAALSTPLAPGATQVVRVPLGGPSGPLILTVGVQRFSVQPGLGEGR